MRFIAGFLVLLACAGATPAGPLAAEEQRLETDLGQRVWVRPLGGGAWLVRSVSPLAGFGDVESNAVLVTGPAEAVLLDTPATDAQTEVVLAWAEQALRHPVRHLVVTHWHADRLGGLGAARARHVAAHAFGKTQALAKAHGVPVPEHALAAEEHVTLSGVPLEIGYPGHGHTADNIVVWLPGLALLDGGCFVKASDARAMGNVGESDLAQWARGIAALQRRYPQARRVIPGHGSPGGPELLARTAELLAAQGR